MVKKQWLPTFTQKISTEAMILQKLRTEWKSSIEPNGEIIAGYVRDAISLMTAENIYEIGNELCPHVNYGLHKRECATCWQSLFKEIKNAKH